MFVLSTILTLYLLSSNAEALLAGLPLTGPISPFIGSIPALVKTNTLISALNSSVGGFLGTNAMYSNGFFWPPPPALVANVVQRELLQMYGLNGLGLGLGGGLGLYGLGGLGGLGLGSLSSLGLLGGGLGLGLTGGLEVIRIPLSSSSSASQQCQAPCFICSPQTTSSSCTPMIIQLATTTTTTQASVSGTQCCCCVTMGR